MADPKAIFTEEDTTDDDSSVLQTQPVCLKCGQRQKMMKCCTRCHSAFYCSKPCFVKHWPEHKADCRPQSQRLSYTHGTGEDDDREVTYRIVHHGVSEPTQAKKKTKLSAAKQTEPSSPPISSPPISSPPISEAELPGVEITVRYNKQKHKFKVCDAWTGETIFQKLSEFLSVIPTTMKLIHKGKQLHADTLRGVVSPGAVLQVLAEGKEGEEGLESRDIEVLMAQMGVERNMAIRALRQTGGDLIDAMMNIGNK